MSAPIPIPKSKSQPAGLDETLTSGSPDLFSGSTPRGSFSSNGDISSPNAGLQGPPAGLGPNGCKTPNTSSSPPSPSIGLSRTASTSSFQEDDQFPPLEKMTILDILENLALPQRLEKIQHMASIHTERVRRQQQRLKTTGLSAKDRVVDEWRRRLPTADEQLDKYRKRMRDSVDRLGKRWNNSKTITLREKVSFIAGCMNIFISGYLIGAHPEWFHYWYAAQLIYFMPIRFITYHRRGMHYFLVDLCYFVNLLTVLSIWVFPRSKRLFISAFCLAFGNNAVAIAMWRNSLVFHSVEKVTSLFIHIMPPVTLHCLVHLFPEAEQKVRFPAIWTLKNPQSRGPFYYSLPEMLFWATIPYAIWQLSYHFFITVRRREKIAAGRPTSFTWLRRSYKGTWLGNFVLRQPEALQEPTFMMIQYIYALITMLPCPIWFCYRWFSAAYMMVVFAWSCWNGASYYLDVFGKRFQKELEALKKDVAKWQQSPEGPKGKITPLLTPVDGVSLGQAAQAPGAFTSTASTPAVEKGNDPFVKENGERKASDASDGGGLIPGLGIGNQEDTSTGNHGRSGSLDAIPLLDHETGLQSGKIKRQVSGISSGLAAEKAGDEGEMRERKQ
ncbi:hypothetical protein EV356DRAFT_453374 [Viridothelium virens]|uniref:Glycerophosphocholine acyltransferase 1 n=1 Tax=Viridothelium virens TaxID=1048519 RepID=A0A6A6GYV4_VIRVR|nr:hypothetical protein EV356DRAFT_453374 [Viridothelium virens]